MINQPLTFKGEYRFFRRKGFRPLKSAWRAWNNVQESKRIIALRNRNDA